MGTETAKDILLNGVQNESVRCPKWGLGWLSRRCGIVTVFGKGCDRAQPSKKNILHMAVQNVQVV
jgi:hypothetical protein